jgi:hypothetical protein
VDDYFSGSKPQGAPSPQAPAVPPVPPQAPPQWSRANVPPSPFGAPEPSPFGAPEPSPFGAAPAPTAWSGMPPPPPAGTSTSIKVAIAALATVGSLVVAAIAIPVLFDTKGKKIYEKTRVDLPATVIGLTKRTDSAAEQMVQPLRDVDAPGEPLVAAYGGVAQPELVVMVTRYHMTNNDQKDFLSGVRKGARGTALGLGEFSSVSAGVLGGQAQCASSTLLTMCVFADPGAYGVVMAFGTPAHGLEVWPTVRTSVEHRT